MATPSPIVSMAPTSVTTMNAGSSAQNSVPGVTSRPGQSRNGRPTHAASAIAPVSYSPNGAPTAHPRMMPATGDHSRSDGGARSTMPPTTSSVTPAASGAAMSSVPSGTLVSEPKMTGATVTAISMITVPVTTGVKIRRSNDSRHASRNWNSAETTTRLASVAGPASSSAATHTAMNAPDVPMMSTCPEPKRPHRAACSTVVSPQTTIAANTPHVR